VANADGSAARALPGGYSNGIGQVAWSNSSTLVVNVNFSLKRLAWPSGKQKTLTPHGVGETTFSLAQGRVAVGSPECQGSCAGPLTVTDVRTGRTIEVGDPSTYHGDPSLSPDGTEVAFDGLSVQPADGTGAARLLVAGGGCPQWSPDGRTILYRDEADELRLIPAAGGTPGPPLAKNPTCVATWSPDSAHFAVTEGLRVVIVDTATHTVRQFPKTLGLVGAVAWSPDGKHLLAESERKAYANCSSLLRLDAKTLIGSVVANGCP
jgi:hypothetical protein